MDPITPTTPAGEPSKKYIRTFAGDIKIFQEGGKPDLAPLIKEQPVLVPAPGPIPLQKESPLQTYSGDFADKLKETQASLATVLAAEQDAGPRIVSMPQRQDLGNLWFIIGGIILLLVSGVGGYLVYSQYLSSVEPVILAPSVSAPIFVDDREKISGTGVPLARTIQQSSLRTPPAGTVRLLYLDVATSTGASVFSALNLSAPGKLLRNIRPEYSMAGIVSASGAASPFFILSVSSYGETFSGMLSWETVLPRDLAILYPSYPSQSTSTPSITENFVDEIAANRDVRVYRDREGRSVVLYGFWNQNTLIIARDAAAFIEIIGRLATSRAVQ